MAEHKRLQYTCAKCNHHDRIDSAEYFEVLFDDNQFTELDADLTSGDPLHFVDTKAYPQRIVATQQQHRPERCRAHGPRPAQRPVDLVVAAWTSSLLAARWARWWARKLPAPSTMPASTACLS